MRKIFTGAGSLAFCFLAAASFASAAPTCTGNLLTDYSGDSNTATSGGLQSPGAGSPQLTCSIGSLSFSNFSFLLDSGSFSTSAPDISVEDAAVIGSQAILQFDPNIAAGSDLLFEDQVTGGTFGVDLSTTIAGTGFVNETVCTVFASNGICSPADTLAILNVSGQGSNPESVSASIGEACSGCSFSTAGGNASVTFGVGQGEVWIIKDINSGSAAFSEVEQSYGTPEPMTMSLVGFGLLGLGLVGRKLRK